MSISSRARRAIRQYVELGLPLDAVAAAYQCDAKDLLQSMGPELLRLRLAKLAELAAVLQEMALSQKSVTLSLAWYRLLAQSVLDWPTHEANLTEGYSHPSVVHKSTLELTQMSSEELQDEINRLIHCDA